MIFAIILSIIISLVVYFGGGWCIYNIYLSCIDIDTMSIQEIYNSQLLTYDIVALVTNLIFLYIAEKSSGYISDFIMYLGLGIPIATYILFAHFLPISEGGAILNTVLNVLAMIICGVVCIDD